MSSECRALMRQAANTNADAPAVTAGGETRTFSEAWHRAIRFARGLEELGVSVGDRVAVLEQNSLDAVDVFVGALTGGFVRVPLYARNSIEAHRHMLETVGATALVVSEKFSDSAEELRSALAGPAAVVIRDSEYDAWLESQSPVDPDPPIRPDDPCVIRFTSGTTGLPKASMYTHARWLALGRDWFYTFPPVQVGDACLHAGPISHGSGYLFMPTWLAGGRNVLLSDFDPRVVLETIEAERIKYFFLVPTMLADLIDLVDEVGADTSSLQVLEVSGGPLSPALARRAMDAFGPVLYQRYSQTESGVAVVMSPADWARGVPGSDPTTSVGRANPFIEVEVRGDNMERLAAGEIGEIAIRGPGRMECFWGDDDATAARLVDGWIFTGDIGRIDANGYVYLHDRKANLIISGGFNIWPAELERVINTLPGVREAAVFGVEHERWGETPVAVCVVESGSSLDEDEVIAVCRDRLGSYKKPSRVVFTDRPLPRTPVGKVSARMVRDEFLANRF